MNKRNKAIRKCTNEREILYHYLDEPIEFECTYRCCKQVLEEGYVGKSILLTDIRLKHIGGHYIQHIWIRVGNIINLNEHCLKAGTRLRCIGRPYEYVHLHRGKPMSLKYSFKDVQIVEVVS